MTKSAGKLTKTLDRQVFETGNKNDNIFYIPKSKTERLSTLRLFVMKECYRAWSGEDRKISTMKKEYLSELIESLLS